MLKYITRSTVVQDS